MRWRIRRIKNPKLGEVGWGTKFAFLPTQTDDGQTVWLERYLVQYVYDSYFPFWTEGSRRRWEVQKRWSKGSKEWTEGLYKMNLRWK